MISKSISPGVVPEDGRLTYTFVITNCGGTPAETGDAVTVTDVFAPVLHDIFVTLNGKPVAAAQYDYAPATGVFGTSPGAIVVPAAVSTGDADTGVWTTAPGAATLVVSGTI